MALGLLAASLFILFAGAEGAMAQVPAVPREPSASGCPQHGGHHSGQRRQHWRQDRKRPLPASGRKRSAHNSDDRQGLDSRYQRPSDTQERGHRNPPIRPHGAHPRGGSPVRHTHQICRETLFRGFTSCRACSSRVWRTLAGGASALGRRQRLRHGRGSCLRGKRHRRRSFVPGAEEALERLKRGELDALVYVGGEPSTPSIALATKIRYIFWTWSICRRYR